MSIPQCQFYVKNGWFDPTKPDPQPTGGGIAGFGGAAGDSGGSSDSSGSSSAAAAVGSVFGF